MVRGHGGTIGTVVDANVHERKEEVWVLFVPSAIATMTRKRPCDDNLAPPKRIMSKSKQTNKQKKFYCCCTMHFHRFQCRLIFFFSFVFYINSSCAGVPGDLQKRFNEVQDAVQKMRADIAITKQQQADLKQEKYDLQRQYEGLVPSDAELQRHPLPVNGEDRVHKVDISKDANRIIGIVAWDEGIRTAGQGAVLSLWELLQLVDPQ
jgi:hypothetical protein